jgi:toxin-antitoxin system PIN domain toxin
VATLVVTLLDVNVLIALFDADHVHHDLAHDWFADEGAKAWATCPTTENGFLRVLSNPAYHGPDLRSKDLAERLRQFCGTRGHHVWPDAVSLHDARLFDLSYVAGHRQLTDVYLAGLAKQMKGRLATFDRGIPLKAVVGAKPDLLQIIEP